MQLEVGATTERVEVIATGVELKTDDASLGATIDQTRVVELPIVNRTSPAWSLSAVPSRNIAVEADSESQDDFRGMPRL